jgi:hypothetical protein
MTHTTITITIIIGGSAVEILANVAFGTNSPRFADVTDVLLVGGHPSFGFFDLVRVFGVGEGPLGGDDGGAVGLGCVRAVD